MDEWRPWATFGEPSRSVLKAPLSFIIDETGCDALPLMHMLIGQAVKERDSTGRVALITLQRPSREFVRTSRRLGHDLTLVSIQGRFMALDAVGEAAGPKFYSLDMLSPQAESIILERIGALGQTVSIFIDGLDALCTIAGWPLARIMRLVKSLESLGSVVVCRLTASPSVSYLLRWLVYRSHFTIVCKGLSSGGGSTSHAHGQLIVYPSETNDLAGLQLPSSFLFKCTDATLLLQSKFLDPLQASLEDTINTQL